MIREERPHIVLTITAWRLSDRNGHPTSCLISERDSRWQVLVWHKASIVYWDRYDTDDAALDRADDLWRALIKLGWSTQPATRGRLYRRTCPECHRHSAVATQRHHPAVSMLCTTCKRGWDDRERLGVPDRRTSRPNEDRRQEA